MYKFANNFNYDEESSETVEPQAEAEIQESTNDEIARESDNRPKAAQDHSKKARTLPKTGCYAVPPISQPGSPLEKKHHSLRLNLEPSWVTHAHLLLAFIEASKAKSKSM